MDYLIYIIYVSILNNLTYSSNYDNLNYKYNFDVEHEI